MSSVETYSVPCIFVRERTALPDVLKVTVPGSKSITNRALLLAMLADGTSVLSGALFSDDSRHFAQCAKDLGFEVETDEDAAQIRVTGCGGLIPKKESSIYVGSAGTAARFLTAVLGISHGTYHLDASAQMRKRPMAPLLRGLEGLGCKVSCEEETDCFPFTLRSNGFCSDHARINVDRSSQFLSALLISSCLSPSDFTIDVEGSHGMAYVEMTGRMMEQFGVRCEMKKTDDGSTRFVTSAGQQYKSRDYQIEPDVSGASYFYALCPLLNVPVQVSHVHFDSLQGDVEFLRILERLGCTAKDLPEGILLLPPADGKYPGITVDMSACSDQAITMAALAPFAQGPTTITGIGHVRFQESDRLSAICSELERMGIHCKATDSSVTIHPGEPIPCLVNTYEDHRMAMGFTLIGLRSPGIVINDPSCCKKTFENYYEVLEKVLCISPATC